MKKVQKIERFVDSLGMQHKTEELARLRQASINLGEILAKYISVDVNDIEPIEIAKDLLEDALYREYAHDIIMEYTKALESTEKLGKDNGNYTLKNQHKKC